MMVGTGPTVCSSWYTIVDPSYFITEERWQGLQRVKKGRFSHKNGMDPGNKNPMQIVARRTATQNMTVGLCA